MEARHGVFVPTMAMDLDDSSNCRLSDIKASISSIKSKRQS